ncbi:phosphatidylglycerophosphatase [Wolbachia pipientis]|uniref:Phosphatidylglycerophosphatase n=1 Tax=Wolbachia pipientis TaxID=955 RepID=A0A1E7QIZ8_WOLPI|nr:phosphatidylglycerophosphatase [Wolbachia pipientis]OEY86443.1 phosphatidylglycerophosphatase [Wolbachia pipientis]
MAKLSVFFGKILGKVFPGQTVSSFLGVGFLPSWQNYWSTFLVLFTTDTILLFTISGKYLLSTIVISDSAIMLAAIFLKIAIAMLIVQVIGIFVFHAQDPSANSSENIVVQMATGQIMTVAFSMPAIVSVHYVINTLYGDVCKQILPCPTWLNDFMYFLFFLIIPFIFFNIVEIIKPWPINFLQLNYNNAISITLEGIVYTFYTVALLYLTAFVFCNLEMNTAIALNTKVMQYVYNDLLRLGHYLCSLFSGQV